jgi:plastocyanin
MRLVMTVVLFLNALPLHAATQVVQLTMRDGRFYPDTLTVQAGVRVKIELHNAGTDAEEFESLPLRKEKVLAPGARSFVVIAPLKPGTYPFFGEFHPATAQGRLIAR